MTVELIKVLSDLVTLIGAWRTKEVAVEEEFLPKLEVLATALTAQVAKAKAVKAEDK